MLSGLLPIWKPSGLISKDVSRLIQRRFGKLQIGHVGTLDPMAEGVLPILIGNATRFQDYLLVAPKTYEFDLRFGQETDTLDATGTLTTELPVPDFDLDAVRGCLPQFLGAIEQIPPLYSAIQYQGQRLHELARSGQADRVPLELLTRRVNVHGLACLWLRDGVARFVVTGSKGLYVRSLGRDIASALGTCGTITTLIRSAAALIDRHETLSLAVFDAPETQLASLLVPVNAMRLPIPTVRIRNADHIKMLENGRSVRLNDLVDIEILKPSFGLDRVAELQEDSLRLLRPDGGILGLGIRESLDDGGLLIRMKRRV